MSSPTRPLLPSFFLNMVYPFLEVFPCLMRWSWRRRARARRTRACVVRQCGVLVFAFAEFIFGGPFLLCSVERAGDWRARLRRSSEEHTSELQSLAYLVCRLLLEKKNTLHS